MKSILGRQIIDFWFIVGGSGRAVQVLAETDAGNAGTARDVVDVTVQYSDNSVEPAPRALGPIVGLEARGQSAGIDHHQALRGLANMAGEKGGSQDASARDGCPMEARLRFGDGGRRVDLIFSRRTRQLFGRGTVKNAIVPIGQNDRSSRDANSPVVASGARRYRGLGVRDPTQADDVTSQLISEARVPPPWWDEAPRHRRTAAW
jgi:hypothetical protein